MKTTSPRVRFRSWVIGVYLVGFLLAVTWPGATFFNSFEPQVLGLPFNLAWPAGWVLLGFVVLIWLNLAVEAEEDAGNAGTDSRGDA